MKDRNTENNTKYYRDNGYFDKRSTYVWDKKGSLDDIIIGWIPNELVQILKRFQKSPRNKEIENLLIEWSDKVINFIRHLWSQRNKDMIEWEKAHDITNVEKRKKCSNKKVELDRRKRRILGKRILYYHTVNEKFYDKVKEIIFSL